jgi:hypothetical protein
MKHIFVLILLTMLVLTVNAQDQSTRFERQHHSQFVESHLKQTEQMLFKSFESDKPGIVSSSVQTLRELEQIFPKYDFDLLINPLMKLVEDENGDTQVRILSALALDGLHSDKGDKSIYKMAKSSNNKSVKDICVALSVESFKNDMVSNNSN